MAMGEQIRRRRERMGMTSKELAHKIGVTEATMSRYETNQIKNPDQNKIRELARVLNVDINYLMGFEIDGQQEKDREWELNEDEKELITIFRSLDRRTKHQMMSRAYEFERRAGRHYRLQDDQ